MLTTFWWRFLTIIALALAVLGAVLPGLPATEFVLLAAWSSGKGWPAVNNWLLNHKTFGPVITQWNTHKIMPRKAKIFCCITMGISVYLLVSSQMMLWLKVLLILTILLVLCWLLSRPERVYQQI
ncbi:YbaN family protein [Catenovulum sp. 2E275]|uniref:YbaN family protein n=1 Tax=Catenovulum sp. 2E275 TaxID=2980497 RepID=UPI0021CF55C4|nr:YbaN family protein [Catenovulum sp. 2E275]MCU4675295.1 YbaN family protein [Catenovulum sp. 2E275]